MDFSVLKEHPHSTRDFAELHPWTGAMAFVPAALWPWLSDGSLTSRTGRLSLQQNHGRAI
jgi:hypothetical protein